MLADITDRELLGGAQALLVELGADIAVDGAIGPASTAALREILGADAAAAMGTAPIDILIGTAAAHRKAFGFRVDLL